MNTARHLYDAMVIIDTIVLAYIIPYGDPTTRTWIRTALVACVCSADIGPLTNNTEKVP